MLKRLLAWVSGLDVPRRDAERVARYARETLDKDKAGRRVLYEKLGLPLTPR